MNGTLLGFVEKEPGVFEPVYAEGRYLDGIPFKEPPEAQGKALFNPWGGTIKAGDIDTGKLAQKTIYVQLPRAEGGGFRMSFDF